MKIISLLRIASSRVLPAGLLLLLSGLSPAQERARGPVDYPALRAGVTLQKNIPYDRYPGTILDVLSPAQTGAAPRPAIVVFHGGGWVHTGKETAYESLCLPFLLRGFVVVNAEYRVAAQATAPAAITDALNATHWLYKHAKQYNVDTHRILVTGGSAGGHLALMVSMIPKSAKLGPITPIAAVIDGYGPTDALELLAGPHHQTWATDWIPASPNRVALAQKVSPLTYVRPGLPPTFIAQGADDPTVPPEQSVRLHNALDLAGVPNQIEVVPNAKHGFNRAQWTELYPKIFAFLQAHNIEGPIKAND